MIIPQFKFECVKCLHEQEIGSQFHVPIRLFDESRMTWIFKGIPIDFLDFVEEWFYHKVLRNIFVAISDKCGDANEVQTIDNWPIL